MEDFVEKYSKWFPYCEKDKLKEQMRQDLRAMADAKSENAVCCASCEMFTNYKPACSKCINYNNWRKTIGPLIDKNMNFKITE